jgi:TP901-1 family phage major tail protein
MAAQKGKDLLVKIHDGSSFVTVAGLRTRRLAFNAETVDVTHAESAGRWRELLEGAGIKRAGIAGRGLFKDASTDALMRQTFFDGAVKTYQVVIPDFGTVEGAFQITSLEFAGEQSLESALTFTAA